MTSHCCHDITIPCSSGNIEGRLRYSKENRETSGVILCPPHPLLAGNMDNNIIIALAENLVNHFSVLTFNYRGVGRSFKTEPDLPLFEYWDRLDQRGDFSEIIMDTEQVIRWSTRYFRHFHLVGYSFGSFIGLSALPQSSLSFTGIAPPLREHNFQRLIGITCRTLLVFAENDNLLTQEKGSLPTQTRIYEVPETDHFFIGRELEVAQLLNSFLLSVDSFPALCR